MDLSHEQRIQIQRAEVWQDEIDRLVGMYQLATGATIAIDGFGREYIKGGVNPTICTKTSTENNRVEVWLEPPIKVLPVKLVKEDTPLGISIRTERIPAVIRSFGGI